MRFDDLRSAVGMTLKATGVVEGGGGGESTSRLDGDASRTKLWLRAKLEERGEG